MQHIMGKRFSLLILLVGLYLSWAQSAQAQWEEAAKINLSSEAELSILTATGIPMEVYTRFGHAGIRIVDSKQDIDLCFDYGIFSFEEPNFLWRFVKGETDFWVEGQHTTSFMHTWLGRGSRITELVVNLDSLEINRAWKALCINMLPENRLYRYNYLYDNCATRTIKILDIATEGRIIYPQLEPPVRWRQLLDECCAGSTWLKFGLDLALGAKTDKVASAEEQTFLPVRLNDILPHSKIKTADGRSKEMLKEQRLLREATIHLTDKKENLPSPLLTFTVVMLLVLIVTANDLKKNKTSRYLDLIVYSLAGLGGILIFFLMVVSEHPQTTPNYIIAMLHPLHLFVAVPLMLVPKWKKGLYYYHFINFAVLLILALVVWFLPQQQVPALWPIGIALAAISLRTVLLDRWKKNVR